MINQDHHGLTRHHGRTAQIEALVRFDTRCFSVVDVVLGGKADEALCQLSLGTSVDKAHSTFVDKQLKDMSRLGDQPATIATQVHDKAIAVNDALKPLAHLLKDIAVIKRADTDVAQVMRHDAVVGIEIALAGATGSLGVDLGRLQHAGEFIAEFGQEFAHAIAGADCVGDACIKAVTQRGPIQSDKSLLVKKPFLDSNPGAVKHIAPDLIGAFVDSHDYSPELRAG